MRTATWTVILAASALAGCAGGVPGTGTRAELASGTRISATFDATVSSRENAPGDHVTVTVAGDVTDSAGTVVIPAGAKIDLTIAAIGPAAHKGGEGTLTFDVGDVTIEGKSTGLDARVTRFDYAMKGSGIGAAEVGKTAAGGVAGAIIGHAVGGDDGTAVGAIGGAAAGAAIADYTQDRDIVINAGNAIVLTLRDAFARES